MFDLRKRRQLLCTMQVSRRRPRTNLGSSVHAFIAKCVGATTFFLAEKRRIDIDIRIMEILDRRLVFRGKTGADYHVHNHRVLKRAMEGKQRQTSWIDGFPAGSTFWDVGSNVGVYSMYAAMRGLNVVAIEPESRSFDLLQRNAQLNRLSSLVTALNVALFETTGLVPLRIAYEEAGMPHHQVDLTSGADRKIMAFTASDLCQIMKVPPPNYVKIDVDGSELQVIRGLDLSSSALRDVLCELRDNGDAAQIFSLFDRYGFRADGSIDDVRKNGDAATYILFSRA